MSNQEPQTKPDGGASVSTAGLGGAWDGMERREVWAHLGGMFAIRRTATRHPLVEGAAYGTEMVERRVIPDRRRTKEEKIADKISSIIENDSGLFRRAREEGLRHGGFDSGNPHKKTLNVELIGDARHEKE